MPTFAWVPDFPIAADEQPHTRVAKFGDGYEQRVGDGLNTSPLTYQLQFGMRAQAERDAIVAFLRTNKHQSFDWTPTNEAAGKYVCRKWSARRMNAAYHTVMATFTQVFEG